MSLNNESSIIRPTLIDLNPDELKYYRFMIRLVYINVVGFLMSYLRKYVHQKQKLKHLI